MINQFRPPHCLSVLLLALALPGCGEDEPELTAPGTTSMNMNTGTGMGGTSTAPSSGPSGIDSTTASLVESKPTSETTSAMTPETTSSGGQPTTQSVQPSSSSDTSATSSSSKDTATNSAEDPKIKHEKIGDNIQTTIDATDKTVWVFLDLDRRAMWRATYAAERQNNTWDLCFQRYLIRLNGGHNGNAGVKALWIEGEQAYEMLSKAPTEGFKSDVKPSGDKIGEEGLVFSDWYNYDFTMHTLSPKPRAYVVRSSENQAFKFKMQDYYSAGASGHPKFLWAPI